MKYRSGTCASLLFGAGLVAITGLFPLSARADDAAGTNEATASAPSAAVVAPAKKLRAAKASPKAAVAGDADSYSPAKPYFVEFHARNAASYGHFYVLYGEVNSRDEIIKSHIAGFFPAGDARNCENCSVFNWTIGHVIFVPSEIGVSDGDLEEKYVAARFRVRLSPAEYRKLVAYIEERKANRPLWNALWKNCVTFGRDIAAYMGLNLPILLAIAPSIMIYPKDFVNQLRESNGVPNEQPPLKDAAGSLESLTGPAPDEATVAAMPRKPKVRTAVNAQAQTKAAHAATTPKKPLADMSGDETAGSSTNTIH
jgi:hypothetical protein